MRSLSSDANAKSRFYLPWYADAGVLTALMARRNGNSISVYGCLRGLAPSGRPNDSIESTREDLEALVQHCKKIGVATTYLLNGLGSGHGAWPNNLLRWLCKSLRPSAVCVTELNLARRLVKAWPDVCLEISTIAGCIEQKKASTYLTDPEIGHCVKALCLHHDATSHNWEHTRMFASGLMERRVEPFVLVNESCMVECPARENHYRLFGSRAKMCWTKDFADPYQIGCVLTRLMEPWTLLNLAGFLQPSMLEGFTKTTGIRGFKLAGRSNPWQWVANAFRHYATRKDPANIYELVVFTVPFLDRWHMTGSDLFHVDASAHREVHASLTRVRSSVERRTFLKTQAARMFEKGQLRVGDPGSEYAVRDGNLMLVKPGEYVSFLCALRIKGAK